MKDAQSVTHARTLPVRAVLLDTYKKGVLGGSGEPFDWRWVRAAKRLGPIILAGGLTPENVGEAVRRAAPYGVDVSSGVEAEIGKKDHKKLQQFIAAAKGAERP